MQIAQSPQHDEYANLPFEIYSSQSVRGIDRFVIDQCGIDGFELMNKAARFSFHALIKEWPDTENIIVLCGSGNNAGDGYIMAALAKKRGINVDVFFAATPERLNGDALSAYQMCLSEKVSCKKYESAKFKSLCEKPNTVIVDALLGTGLNTDVSGLFANIIAEANTQASPIIAIDIPSGLCANTGYPLGSAIDATLTATFIGLKLGLFTGAGREYSGKIVFSALDLSADTAKHILPIAHRLDLSELLLQLAPRRQDAHKGQSGHVAILGGDLNYGGAVILAAKAAARMGAGLTTVITQESHRHAILSHIPEAMIHSTQNAQEIDLILSKVDTIVIGPGLGQSAWSEKLLLCALNSQKPLVIDADAINLLSKKHHELIELDLFQNNNHVFTPHPGEAARLLAIETSQVQQDRLSALKQLQQKWGGNILLKGSGSLITDTHNQYSLCPYGNPGMATGGMGDALSGFIGGLMAQSLEPIYALKLAACLHARAADIACEQSGQRGILASDLIPIARSLLNIKA